MMKSGRLKSFLAAIAFVCFIVAGFLTVNVMTSCRSQAQCVCGMICIGMPGGLGDAMTLEINGAVLIPDIAIVVTTLSVHMELALTGFQEAIDEKIFETTQNIDSWIDTFWWYNLRPAMQAQTRQLNTFDSFKDENEGGYADAADANRVGGEYTKRGIDSHREQRPSQQVCVAGTISGGMTRTAVFRRAYETAAAGERHTRTSNDIGAAASNDSTAADQKSRWQNYTSTYCNKDANGGFAGCTASGAQVDRDISVTDEIFAKDTIDLKTPATQKAVDDILINLAEPQIEDPVPPQAVNSAEGEEALLAGQAYKAKREVVYDALYYVVSRRAPGSVGTTGTPNFLQDMRSAAGVDPSYFSPNPSHNEIMEVMMSERFRTGTYSIEQIDEPENNQREMVVQQAFQAMLLSDELDLLDRYGLVLAAQASGEVKSAKPHRGEAEFAPER